MGRAQLNGRWANGALVIVVATTIVLGVAGASRAVAAAVGLGSPGEGKLLFLSAVVAAMIGWPITRRLVDRRQDGRGQTEV